jgi:hypothetical protein
VVVRTGQATDAQEDDAMRKLAEPTFGIVVHTDALT